MNHETHESDDRCTTGCVVLAMDRVVAALDRNAELIAGAILAMADGTAYPPHYVRSLRAALAAPKEGTTDGLR